jgi:hypothetical protein
MQLAVGSSLMAGDARDTHKDAGYDGTVYYFSARQGGFSWRNSLAAIKPHVWRSNQSNVCLTNCPKNKPTSARRS